MNLFSLFAKLSLDSSEYKQGISDAKDTASNFGDNIAKVVGNVAKVTATAVGASATAVGAIVKQSVDAYADYEQLVGGIQTMFEDLDYDILQNASQAYKTAGLSANEYMETVMGFSASLNASLIASEGDISRSADLADQTIRDMADNANKMGTNMESIQNAYAGFAKQNYTMLDNLKLGYGGTKEEMQRLLKDAEKISGIKYDVSSFADIADAIHIVQTELGITGTTALEASETISGSMASMKSAWENVLIAMADENADFGATIDALVESVVTVGDNIFPRVEQAITGAGTLIEKLLPAIANRIPAIINDVVPKLLTSAINMVETIGQGIGDNLPMLAKTALDLIVSLGNDISKSLPELMPAIVDVMLKIVDVLIDNIDMLIDCALQLITALAEGVIKAIPKLVEKAPQVITSLAEAFARNAPKILEQGVVLILKLAEGIVNTIPQLVAKIPQVIKSLVSSFNSFDSQFTSLGKNIVTGLWNGIAGGWDWLVDSVKSLANTLVAGVKKTLGIHSPSKVFAGIGGFMAEGLGEGWEDGIDEVKKNIENDMSFDAGTATGSIIDKPNASGIVAGATNIVMNIYGAVGQDVNELAEIIEERLSANVRRTDAVWS